MKPWHEWLLLSLLSVGLSMLAGCEGGGSDNDTPADSSPTNDTEEVLAPELVSPANGAVMDNARTDGSESLTWTFSWNPVASASEYHLEAYRSGSGSLVNITTATLNHTFTTTGYLPVLQLTGWRWRVRANVGSAWQEWSSERSFSVETPDTD